MSSFDVLKLMKFFVDNNLGFWLKNEFHKVNNSYGLKFTQLNSRYRKMNEKFSIFKENITRRITVTSLMNRISEQDVYILRYITNDSTLLVKRLAVSGIMKKERELMDCKTL